MSDRLMSRRGAVLTHAVATTWRQFWALPLLGMLPLLILLPGSLFDRYALAAQYFRDPQAPWVVFSAQHGAAVTVCAAVIGLVYAYILFGFLFRPKAVNTYFALGLRRRALFGVRYAHGAASLLLTVSLPLFVSLGMNLWRRGTSPLLWTAFAYLLAGLLVTALAAFTIGAVLCILCGTVVESVLFSLALCAAPAMLAVAAGSLARRFLPGSAVNGLLDFGISPAARADIPLFQLSWPFTPLLLFVNGAQRFLQINLDEAAAAPADYRPDWWLLAAWALVIAALAVLGCRLLRRRKGELADFAGRRVPLTVVCAGLYALLFAALAGGAQTGEAPAALLVAALVFAAVYAVIGLLACWGPSRFLKPLIGLPVLFGAFIVTVLALLTGGLGYSSRVPAVEAIESAEISYRGDINLMGGERRNGQADQVPTIAYTSRADIETVVRLHRTLIDMGRPAYTGKAADPYEESVLQIDPIYVRYQLNNGTTQLRTYDTLSLAAQEDLLALDKTEAVEAHRESLLEQRLLREEWIVSLVEPTQFAEEPVSLSDAARRELCRCLQADLRGQPLADRYFPERAARTILCLRRNPAIETSEFWQVSSANLYLTDAFSRTLAFLKAQGLTLPEAPAAEQPKVTIQPIPLKELSSPRIDPFLQSEDMFSLYGPQTELPFDPALLAACRSTYYTSQPLYLVTFNFSSEENNYFRPACAFLPLEAVADLPMNLRDRIP